MSGPESSTPGGIIIVRPREALEARVEGRLREGLEKCPDVAFAYLAEVHVSGRPDSSRVLFTWLAPRALRSLRSALNLVCETVARVLPSDEFLDVVILNSAPELLDAVERAGVLFVEVDSDERSRALAAARERSDMPLEEPRSWKWWPFG